MLRPVLMLCVAIVLVGAAGVSGSETVVVVKGGDPSPDGTGEISGLSHAFTEKAGEVVFEASIRDEGFLVGGGVFRANTSGSLTAVALKGQPSPDGNGYLDSFDGIFVNSVGGVGFGDFMTGTLGSILDYSAILGGTDSLSIVARGNQAVPDIPGDRFGYVLAPLAFNDAGQVAFFSQTLPQEIIGIWRGDGSPGSLTRIVGTGDPNPTGDGQMFGGLSSLALISVMNESGEVAFHDATDTSSGYYLGIFRGHDVGSLVKIARSEDPTPSGNGVYGGFSAIGFPGVISINDHGEVAFGAYLDGTSGGVVDNFGLFRGNGSSTVELVRKGDAAPDGNGVFSNFYSETPYIINNSGDVLFWSMISAASGGAVEGLFVAGEAGVEQVARLNQAAPGGGVFSAFSARMAMNNAGQVAFEAFVDTAEENSVPGIYLYDAGVLHAVIREGDTIAGMGQVTGFAVAVEDVEAEATFLNEFGQVAYRFFAGGDEGIALFDSQSSLVFFGDGFESGNTAVWSAVKAQ